MTKVKTIPVFWESKYQVNTDQTGSELSFHLGQPLRFNNSMHDVHFRLLLSTIWWTFPNISSDLANNGLRFFVGATQYDIAFEKGLYDLASINSNVSQYLVNNNLLPNLITFSGDLSTGKISVQINQASVFIDWNGSTIRDILGFTQLSSGIGGSAGTYYEADSVAQLNSISNILIHANFSSGAYLNGKKGSNVVASVTPDVTIGSQIVFQPFHPVRTEVLNNTIDEVRIYLTDQDLNRLDTNGENFSVVGEFIIEDK